MSLCHFVEIKANLNHLMKRKANVLDVFSYKYLEKTKMPSLKTQSCIKGLLAVRDFCFGDVWAARPVLKKGSGPIMSNF
jgi:hypothetical protein